MSQEPMDPQFAAVVYDAYGSGLLKSLITSCESLLHAAKQSSGSHILGPVDTPLPQAIIAHKTTLDAIIAGWQEVQAGVTTPDEVNALFAEAGSKGLGFGG